MIDGTGKSSRSRPVFHQISHMFLEINETSANVTLMKAAIQRRWGHDYTLVTADGVELKDSSGTEGMMLTV